MEINDLFYRFIEDNAKADVTSLRLKSHRNSNDFDISFAIDQIECRKKCRTKLSGFISNRKFLFPSIIAAEQSSNQAVAHYHTAMLNDYFRGIATPTLLDMTAGLGIDALTASRSGIKTTAVELDSFKCECLRHNARVLEAENFEVINADSLDFLFKSDKRYDYIFIDPARRAEDNRRVYNLHDCQPDIIKHQNEILKHCGILLIKASPLLDMSQTIKDFPNCDSIRIVCVEGECKEILLSLKYNDNFNTVECIDLKNSGETISRLSYNPAQEYEEVVYASVADIEKSAFLYEPNAAVMKASPWTVLTSKFPGLKKLDPSSHIFISANHYENFPGRVLKIQCIADKSKMKTETGSALNVVARNYPLKPEEIRKKYKLKEGTDNFLYATRCQGTPLFILTTRQ